MIEAQEQKPDTELPHGWWIAPGLFVAILVVIVAMVAI
jgi:hypothetical protein